MGVYFSQTSLIYFCLGFSCGPYYQGVRYHRIPTILVLYTNAEVINRWIKFLVLKKKKQSHYVVNSFQFP